jgi:hypothetical protein
MHAILHINSRFRDIGRCFRRSLPLFLTPIATCGHVIRTYLAVKKPHPPILNNDPPLWCPPTFIDRSSIFAACQRYCQHHDGVPFPFKEGTALTLRIHPLRETSTTIIQNSYSQSHARLSACSVYFLITSLV